MELFVVNIACAIALWSKVTYLRQRLTYKKILIINYLMH